MTNLQLEMWPEEIMRTIIKGLRLRSRMLAKGERPDMRPWAGIFERRLTMQPAENGCVVFTDGEPINEC